MEWKYFRWVHLSIHADRTIKTSQCPGNEEDCVQRCKGLCKAYGNRLPVNLSRGQTQLVTGRLIAQSTSHKLTHNKATSSKNFYLHPETVLNMDGVITASEHTTRHMQCRAVRFGYLGLMSLYHSITVQWQWTCIRCGKNETLHIHVQHGKLLQLVQYRSHWRRRSSWMQQMLGQKVRSTYHTILRCGELTVWRVDWLPGNPTSTCESWVPIEFKLCPYLLDQWLTFHTPQSFPLN